MDEEEEGDSEDEDVDMPSLLPRVVNADEIDRIITHNYSVDGLSKECLQERLIWDRMSRPLLDGGEGKPRNANVQSKNHCHSIAAGQAPRVTVPTATKDITSRQTVGERATPLHQAGESAPHFHPHCVQLGKPAAVRWCGSPADITDEPRDTMKPSETPQGQLGTPQVQPLHGLPTVSRNNPSSSVQRPVKQLQYKMSTKPARRQHQQQKLGATNGGLLLP